jgi:hypothetical protein
MEEPGRKRVLSRVGLVVFKMSGEHEIPLKDAVFPFPILMEYLTLFPTLLQASILELLSTSQTLASFILTPSWSPDI